MSSSHLCICGKTYKTETWLLKHQKQCKRNENTTYSEAGKRTRARNKKLIIPPKLRFGVWKTYIGDKISAKCFCCWETEITPVTSYKTFQAGHIISEYNGGILSICNLLPICKQCNARMNITNWDDFVLQKEKYIPRLYGENIPKHTIQLIIKIQNWWKKYKQARDRARGLTTEKITKHKRYKCKQGARAKKQKFSNKLRGIYVFASRKRGYMRTTETSANKCKRKYIYPRCSTWV